MLHSSLGVTFKITYTQYPSTGRASAVAAFARAAVSFAACLMCVAPAAVAFETALFTVAIAACGVGDTGRQFPPRHSQHRVY